VGPSWRPLQVCRIDVPKQGGLIPDINRSGANRKVGSGLLKVSAVSDTASREWRAPRSAAKTSASALLADTGPQRSSSPYQARFLRMAASSEGFLNTQNMGPRRVEADRLLRGRIHNQNSVNIATPERPSANAAGVGAARHNSWVEACRVRGSSARIGPSILRTLPRPLRNHRDGRSQWATSGSARRCFEAAYNFTLGFERFSLSLQCAAGSG